MEVTVRIRRAVIIDDDVDTLNINTTPEDIGSDQDTLLECLESLVAAYAMRREHLSADVSLG